MNPHIYVHLSPKGWCGKIIDNINFFLIWFSIINSAASQFDSPLKGAVFLELELQLRVGVLLRQKMF